MAPSLPVAAGASLVIPLNDLSQKQIAELEALRREYLQKVEQVLGFRMLGDAFSSEPPNMNVPVAQGFRPGPGPVPIPTPTVVMQQTPGLDQQQQQQRTPMGRGMVTPAPGAITTTTPYTPINHNLTTQEELDAHKRGPATSRSELRKLMGSDSRKSVCGMKAAVRKVCIRHSLELATKYTAIDRDLLKKVEEEIYKELTPIYGWSRFTITKILMSMCQDTRRNHTAALKREAQAQAAQQTPTRKPSGQVDVQGNDGEEDGEGEDDSVENGKRKSTTTPNTSVKRRKPNTNFVIEIDGMGKHYIESGGQAVSDLESFKDFVEEASGNIQLGDEDVLTYRPLTSDPNAAANMTFRPIRTEEDFETMKDENSTGVTIRVIRKASGTYYADFWQQEQPY
ncbi:hypothetical protein BJ508DRAFT_111718 [Ascobolus immersus RN42]|uniref:Uncharacterized protein n=1 Tax=Ascobolus immersus RN42 TaxID=1160509 RepID=A0A3N4I6F2_ASCIM|nr:hypothetical protein BJ508DRAFT_111718 [Ascobolus immersus RN42]